MSRIPLVSVEEMTKEQREQYDRFPSNLTRALLLMEIANGLVRCSGAHPPFRRVVECD